MVTFFVHEDQPVLKHTMYFDFQSAWLGYDTVCTILAAQVWVMEPMQSGTPIADMCAGRQVGGTSLALLPNAVDVSLWQDTVQLEKMATAGGGQDDCCHTGSSSCASISLDEYTIFLGHKVGPVSPPTPPGGSKIYF